MPSSDSATDLNKISGTQALKQQNTSALKKYQDFFVGGRGLGTLLKYELAVVLGSDTPGAAGYLLRKILYKRLFAKCGGGVQFGRNISLRHPGKMVCHMDRETIYP